MIHIVNLEKEPAELERIVLKVDSLYSFPSTDDEEKILRFPIKSMFTFGFVLFFFSLAYILGIGKRVEFSDFLSCLFLEYSLLLIVYACMVESD